MRVSDCCSFEFTLHRDKIVVPDTGAAKWESSPDGASGMRDVGVTGAPPPSASDSARSVDVHSECEVIAMRV